MVETNGIDYYVCVRRNAKGPPPPKRESRYLAIIEDET